MTNLLTELDGSGYARPKMRTVGRRSKVVGVGGWSLNIRVKISIPVFNYGKEAINQFDLN